MSWNRLTVVARLGLVVLVLLAAPSLVAGDDAGLASWPAPPYWLPATAGPDSTSDGAPAPGARSGVASPASP
ncbi:MAG: hypothetical protein DYH06_06805, partial [Acidobacteria bacterium ACB2]|nr:hypothetical protein [Acidobacteria bacterium ACB2]